MFTDANHHVTRHLDPLHDDAPGVARHAEHLEHGAGDLLSTQHTYHHGLHGQVPPGGQQGGEGVGAEDGAQGGRGQPLDTLQTLGRESATVSRSSIGFMYIGNWHKLFFLEIPWKTPSQV